MIQNSEKIVTSCLILNRRDYSESSLIFSAITADYGKLDFIKKGAKKINKKSHESAIDILNVYEVSFIMRDEGLIPSASFELVNSNQAIGLNYKAFEFCSSLAEFINLNTEAFIPLPGTFNCFSNILSFLQHIIEQQLMTQEIIENQLITALNATFKLTFLYENGLLPEFLDNNEQKSDNKYRKLLEIIQAGENSFKQFPKINSNGWLQLSNWADNLCQFNNLKVD